MKPILYLLPNLALFIVVFRMMGARLHAERTAIFVFLCCWLTYSLTLLLATAILPVYSAGYAQFYFWLSIAVWFTALLPLARATVELIARAPALAALVPLVLYAATALAGAILRGQSKSLAALALVLTCWMAVAAGAVWLAASFRAGSPDLLLWRGLGSYFLIFGLGTMSARALRTTYAALDLVIVVGAAIWLALAWFIAPRPDVLVNPEKLALVSSLLIPPGRWGVPNPSGTRARLDGSKHLGQRTRRPFFSPPRRRT